MAAGLHPTAAGLHPTAAGLHPTAAAREAGYADPKHAAYLNLRSSNLIDACRRELAAAGVTPETVAQILFDLLNSTRTVRVEVVDEAAEEPQEKTGRRRRFERVTEPDNRARGRALDAVILLMGMNPAAEARVTVKGAQPAPAVQNDTVDFQVTDEMMRLVKSGAPPVVLLEAMKARSASVANGVPADEGGGDRKG